MFSKEKEPLEYKCRLAAGHEGDGWPRLENYHLSKQFHHFLQFHN